MKKIISIVLIVVIVLAALFFAWKLVHICDHCDKLFVGTGYEPNALYELINENEQIICKSCAEKQHKLSSVLGKSVEDFRYDLFE